MNYEKKHMISNKEIELFINENPVLKKKMMSIQEVIAIIEKVDDKQILLLPVDKNEMSDGFTYYVLTEEEVENLEKTKQVFVINEIYQNFMETMCDDFYKPGMNPLHIVDWKRAVEKFEYPSYRCINSKEIFYLFKDFFNSVLNVLEKEDLPYVFSVKYDEDDEDKEVF